MAGRSGTGRHRLPQARGVLWRPGGGIWRSIRRRRFRLLAWPATLERVVEADGEDAVFVPGHGALVDAAFIGTQREWLRTQM